MAQKVLHCGSQCPRATEKPANAAGGLWLSVSSSGRCMMIGYMFGGRPACTHESACLGRCFRTAAMMSDLHGGGALCSQVALVHAPCGASQGCRDAALSTLCCNRYS